MSACSFASSLSADGEHNFGKVVLHLLSRFHCTRALEKEKLECPMLRCVTRFANLESLLQHVAYCTFTSSGEIWCYEHSRVERLFESRQQVRSIRFGSREVVIRSNKAQSNTAKSDTVQSDTVQSDTVQRDTVQSDTVPRRLPSPPPELSAAAEISELDSIEVAGFTLTSPDSTDELQTASNVVHETRRLDSPSNSQQSHPTRMVAEESSALPSTIEEARVSDFSILSSLLTQTEVAPLQRHVGHRSSHDSLESLDLWFRCKNQSEDVSEAPNAEAEAIAKQPSIETDNRSDARDESRDLQRTEEREQEISDVCLAELLQARSLRIEKHNKTIFLNRQRLFAHLSSCKDCGILAVWIHTYLRAASEEVSQKFGGCQTLNDDIIKTTMEGLRAYLTAETIRLDVSSRAPEGENDLCGLVRLELSVKGIVGTSERNQLHCPVFFQPTTKNALSQARSYFQEFRGVLGSASASLGTLTSKKCETMREWLGKSLTSSGFRHISVPTRLLDLEAWPRYHSKRSGYIKLVTCPSEDSSHAIGPYVTLSHRWGSAQSLTLTRQTISSFGKEISIEALPQTFQDAVRVTRDLGYRYLWIDALCIIQDDAQDWLKESESMASVYFNAACTLAAHCGYDDSAGFLEAMLTPAPSWQIEESSGNRSEKYTLASNFRAQVNGSFLNRRGWVFQERLLSRRILHFTQHHVFFEDEWGVVADDDAQHRKCSSSGSQVYVPETDDKVKLHNIRNGPSQWYRIVEEYSTCALSFDRDRLPALAGLADYFKIYNNAGRYCHGIWTNSWHLGLLWVEVEDSPKELLEAVANTPIAPSWSWARWKGKVVFPERLLDLKASFDNITYEPTQTSPEEPGYLVLEARYEAIHNVTLQLQTRTKGSETREDVRSAFSGDSHIRSLYSVTSGFGSLCKDLEWIALDGKRSPAVRFSSLILATVAEMDLAGGQYASYFLVLEPTDQPKVYRRRGIAGKMGGQSSGLLHTRRSVFALA